MIPVMRILLLVFFVTAPVVWLSGSRAFADYDPLQVSTEPMPAPLDLVVNDAHRHRQIPVLIYLPRQLDAQPVVLFSHGLGGSRTGSAYLGRHWSQRGYIAVFLQHPGSDEALWKNKPIVQGMAAMKQAANTENFLLRVQDVPCVLDELARWNCEPDNALFGRMDMRHIGMSGHSFGAVTTEAVSGERFGAISYTDPRISAAVVMSPSSPRGGNGNSNSAFGSVKIPWLLMTGTKDDAPIGDQTAASRLLVFPALPPGGKYQLVLFGAEHSVFTDRALPGDREPRNPKHHPAILAISTAFWDAYLRSSADARAWLNGSGPRGVLEDADAWSGK
jgi:predicted dienelactone hydrolase